MTGGATINLDASSAEGENAEKKKKFAKKYDLSTTSIFFLHLIKLQMFLVVLML